MPKTYKLELEIVLSSYQQQRAVDVARQLYAALRGQSGFKPGRWRHYPRNLLPKICGCTIESADRYLLDVVTREGQDC
jgi:hypothetical protein